MSANDNMICMNLFNMMTSSAFEDAFCNVSIVILDVFCNK